MAIEELVQPAEASEFVQEVVLNAVEWVDVAPYDVECVLYLFRLVDYQGGPTQLALANGLPDHNQELVEAICEAASHRQAMNLNLDLALELEACMANVEPHSKEYEAAYDAKSWEENNVKDYKADYQKAISKVIDVLTD